MIEFITHESVHSWVLPFAEVWNEPIATYVGNLVMIDMGYEEEARRRIAATIDRASRIDPTMKLYDLHGHGPADARELSTGEANNMHWGKTFSLFEQLRKENPNVVADYFPRQAASGQAQQINKYRYERDGCRAECSHGAGSVPSVSEHGIPVDRAKSAL